MHGVKKGSPYTNNQTSSHHFRLAHHLGNFMDYCNAFGDYTVFSVYDTYTRSFLFIIFSLFLSFCVCFAMLPSSSCLVSPHACISTITSADVDPLHISTLLLVFCHSLFDICAYNRISSLSFLMRQYAYNLVSCVGLCTLLFHTIVFQHSFRFPFCKQWTFTRIVRFVGYIQRSFMHFVRVLHCV
jgi:hypothetical protein